VVIIINPVYFSSFNDIVYKIVIMNCEFIKMVWIADPTSFLMDFFLITGGVRKMVQEIESLITPAEEKISGGKAWQLVLTLYFCVYK